MLDTLTTTELAQLDERMLHAQQQLADVYGAGFGFITAVGMAPVAVPMFDDVTEARRDVNRAYFAQLQSGRVNW